MKASIVWVISVAMLILGISNGARADCAFDPPTVPVFQKKIPGTNRDAILSLDPRVGDDYSYTDGKIAFYAAPASGATCPLTLQPILRLINAKDGRHFYTIDPAERSSKIADTADPGWKDDGQMAACIAPLSESINNRACDVPIFRVVDPTGTMADEYTAAVRNGHDCELSTGCDVAVLGRASPPPIPYVLRTYAETYVPLQTGTPIKATSDGDDVVTAVPLPFPFTFYGTQYTSVNVSTNGLLTFNGSADPAGDASARNLPIPDVRRPHNYVAGWWDDSVVTSNRFYLTQLQPDVSGHRRFIIQWGNGTWIKFGRPDIVRDMQIHLIEGINKIEIHYGSYQGVGGDTATVGIEAPPALDGTSVVGLACSPFCTEANWAKDQVIAFLPQPPGYIVTETHPDQKGPDAYKPLVDGVLGAHPVSTSPTDTATLALPFPFDFDGQRFTKVGVSTSGVMMLGDRLPPFDGGAKIPNIPPDPADVAGNTNVIAPWWDHLFVEPGGGTNHFLTTTLGVAPTRTFVVEWQTLKHFVETDGPRSFVDPTTRQVQVQLFEGSSNILIYYADTGFKGGLGSRGFDHAAVGLINSVGDGTTASFRLLECTADCMEGANDWNGRDNDDQPVSRYGSWPRFTKFVFTTDTVPQVNWHEIFQDYFMADLWLPAGAPQSLGHCGNCHFSNFIFPEEQLYSQMFKTDFSFPTESGCWFTNRDGMTWPFFPPLALTPSGTVNLQSLLVTSPMELTWMSEPEGKGNMPWDNFCLGGEVRDHPDPSNISDEAKSRIKRWLLQNTP